MLNYKLLLLIQLLGKGIKSIAIVTALLGMHVAIGNYVIWKKCSINLEKYKQNLQRIVVRKIYKRKSMQQLLRVTMKHVVIELALSVVVMLGGRGVDLETHITVYLATCYLLVGTQNWFLHSNSVKHAIHLKRKMELISMTQHIQSTDVQETGQKAPKQWSQEELLNVQL